MRVVICGAGLVGYNIAAYLAREDNDVTVLDSQPELIGKINDDLDVRGIVGHASNPDMLELAGAREADILIAVTSVDEINMVACQVGHSLFNVPKKVARIRNKSYLAPAWANLFSRAHMPIDVIISPEIEVARAIHKRLRIPGSTSVMTLADGLVHLAGVRCEERCPVVNTQIRQLSGLFPDLPLEIGMIVREDQIIVPGPDEQMMVNDEVYFFTDQQHLKRSMAIFGHEEMEARSITILGGGNIAYSLIELLRSESKNIHIKVIENREERARELSEFFADIVVIHGDGLQREILEEANIGKTGTYVALTNDDENNILGSLLAKQYGCERVITLINNPGYTSLSKSLGIDATVSPRTSTVSTIMQHVRRGRIKGLHTIRDGVAEVIEAEISETSNLANVAVGDVNLPPDVMIGMIVRKDRIVPVKKSTIIRPDDHLIIIAKTEQVPKVEQMFTVQVDLY